MQLMNRATRVKSSLSSKSSSELEWFWAALGSSFSSSEFQKTHIYGLFKKLYLLFVREKGDCDKWQDRKD